MKGVIKINKIYEIIQEESSDCGICCLECIIKYYNGYIPLEILRINTNTDMNGCNAYELINCAKKYGFNAYGEKIEKINSKFILSRPLIVHFKLKNNLYHFVVIYKIKNNKIYIMDPAIGLNKIDIKEFNKKFTGITLHFEPINTIPRYKKHNFFIKKIIKEFINNKNNYIIILILNIIILILSLIINLEINIINKNYNLFYLLLIIIIINETLILMKNKILINLTTTFNKNIILDFIKKIFNLPLKYLKLKRSGELQTRFIELNELSTNLINFILNFIFDLILGIFIIIILSIISTKILLILLITTLLYIILNIKIYDKLINYIRYMINLEESYNSKLMEYIKYIESIKNLDKYDYFINNINYNLINKSDNNKKLNNKIFIINFINETIINITLLLILLVIVKYNYGVINSLSIFILINYYISIIKRIISYYPLYLSYKTIINKNNDLLSYNNEDLEIIKKFNIIKLQNIVYKINNNIIIKKLSFKIKNKDKIFIYGKSGVGKSTLMRILTKENDNYEGLITIDNKDIKMYDVSNIISYTSQNEYLFDDTILNNITLKDKINPNTLKDVIKICRIDNILKNKNFGLNSEIINNSNISGGEKNRIILARSLIHSKNIIILDEVLKEVDETLEKDIIKDIIEYYKNKTIIYISHRNVSSLFKKCLNFRKE